MRSTFIASLLLFIGTTLSAQQPAPAGGTIFGTIYCADTNLPARFAHVSLVPATVDEAAINQKIEASLQAMQRFQPQTIDANAAAQQLATARASMRSAYYRQSQQATEQSSSVAADFTGHYSLVGVAPGTYYLHVRLDGYADALDQFSIDQITSSDPETARTIAGAVQRLTIIGREEQHFDVRLQRGASLTGRVLYDDGAPAVGWTVTALSESTLHRKPDSPAIMGVNGVAGMRGSTDTDDLGNFRIRSLAAGTYAVTAMISEASSVSTSGRMPNIFHLSLYGGDTFRSSEASSYTLTAGATRSDIIITVPLNKVHTIRGFVVAKSDGHRPGSGTARIVGKDDPGFQSLTVVAADGSFTFAAIPSGAYTITLGGVEDAQITPYSNSDGDAHSATRHYAPASLPVAVGDVDLDGVAVTVPETSPQP